MDILASFHRHIDSEKSVGTRFILLGILLLVIAGYCFWIVDKTDLDSGLKWTSVVIGVLMVASGLIYGNQSRATKQANTALYESDKPQFMAKELERATKLNKGYGQYRLVWIGIILATVAVIWFLPNSIWCGIACAVLLFTVGAVVIEAISEINTKKYLTDLTVMAPVN